MKSFQTKLKAKLIKARGFTLLELVVVIAIIGILAVIVLPNFIQALAKARDAKKMTELRGIQTFLTTTGIDTNLRYPADSTVLRDWFTNTKNRPPLGLSQTNPIYHYLGINCDTLGGSVAVGGVSYTNTCSSYQLWTELEVDNAALRLDADMVYAAAGPCALSPVTGPCINSGDLDSTFTTVSGSVSTPATVSDIVTGTGGNSEACVVRNNALGQEDCVFDLVP